MTTVTNIPVSLCEYALVNRKVNQLKLYIYLKLNSDGYIRFDETSIKKCSETIGIHIKTVKSSLKWLVKNKWITINSKRQVLHVTSYNRLKNKLKTNVKTGAFIDLKDTAEYKLFEALCCAIVITYYLGRKHYFDKWSERKYGGSNTNHNKVKGFYPMPNGYLAKCLNLSISTAYRIKQKAEDAGYIKTKSNNIFLEKEDGSRIDKDYFELIRSVELKEGKPDRLRKGRKYIKFVSADLIKSTVKCKKKGY